MSDFTQPPRMTIEEAQTKTRPTIVVGSFYPFYSEMEQEYEPIELRNRQYTGQIVQVIADRGRDHPEFSRAYDVRAADGRTFVAMEEELDGWDFNLGQYYRPTGDS